MEQALADQRREAAERRAAEAEAARPKVELRVEYAGKRNYRLRNRGNATAEDVIIVNPCGAVDVWPVPLSLLPGEAHAFMIVGDFQNPVPTEISVSWDGQATPAILPVP